MVFVDTNYFLRFILKDNTEQYEIAKNLFRKADDNKNLLFTSTIVIFEISFVLEKLYKLPKAEIISVLKKIINLQYLYLEEKDRLVKTINLYSENNISFEDSYNLAYSQEHKCDNFHTFDQKLHSVFKKYS